MKKKLINNFNCSKYTSTLVYTCLQSGCIDSGICRCGTIDRFEVEYVDLNKMTDEIYSQYLLVDEKAKKLEKSIESVLYGGEVTDKYCIYRILSKYKAWNTDYWSPNIIQSYYGEEISGVSINENIFSKIKKDYNNILSFNSLSDKIRYVLNLEYEYILEDLKKCDFELVEINKNEINLEKSNTNHIQTIKDKKLYFYSDQNYLLPRGIVRKAIDGYKIVDGYHRILSSKKDKIKLFLVKNNI